MLKDDTQRYGLLKDDALIILYTDFKIGVTHPNLACKNIDFWERALVAERQCGETKCSLDSPPPPRVILSVVELSCLHESARRYADAESRGGFAQDDALIKLCTDFPIGIYTSKSCL